MSEIAIRAEGLGKQYRIGQRERYKALRDTLTDALYAPFRRVASAFGNGQSTTHNAPSDDTIWSLMDVSFEVTQGEVVGIIGRNGAGKSTLLKVLSRITEPTTGIAEIVGRVGSLLEVGTGFHPELTGRENVYLNGAILGMRRAEIDRQFDNIVSFAGVEKFIDTPVKHFSSGMHVRLAFAVAAHLEPEILLVDEVLAVGDVEFQQKCLGKMQSVSREGRTVLLVSHNMAAIRNLCHRTILLDSGRIVFDGRPDEAIHKYLARNLEEESRASLTGFEGKVEGLILRDHPTIRFREISLTDDQGHSRNRFRSDERICVRIVYDCLAVVNDLRIVVVLVDEESTLILATINCDAISEKAFYRREPGRYTSSCVIPENTFGERRLYVTVHLQYPKVEHLIVDKALGFDVAFQGYNNLQYGGWKESILRPQLIWETRQVDKREG